MFTNISRCFIMYCRVCKLWRDIGQRPSLWTSIRNGR